MLLGKEVKFFIVIKDLGVYIDCYFNYNEYIVKIVLICIYMLSCVNRIKYFLDSKIFVFLMNVFIFSRLYYCFMVWSNMIKENIKKF